VKLTVAPAIGTPSILTFVEIMSGAPLAAGEVRLAVIERNSVIEERSGEVCVVKLPV
jgi:hypothetical protein